MEQNQKTLTALQDFNIRNLLDRANKLGIQKDDIVTLFREDGNGCFLIYYK